ncbi:MAG: cellulase family glycosylhydrolase [Eubacteriales bacterium]|nr:cellulase family glycosylhydrolase [Eubacteriales bacterium]
MKRLLSIILTLVLLFTFVTGCDKDDTDNSSSKTSKPTTSSSETDSSEDNTSSEEEVEEEFETPSKPNTGGIVDTDTSNTSNNSSQPATNDSERPLRERMQGGINFPGFSHSDPNSFVFDRNYYDLLVQSGFDNLRLPVGAHNYIVGEAPDYLLDTSIMRMLDIALNHGLEAGLVVVLDFHNNSLFQKEPTIFKQIWRQMAERYRDYPEELMFEIVNEPNGISDDYLNKVQLETVKIIRESNPTRTIALAVNAWNQISRLYGTEIPKIVGANGVSENDPNVILAVHSYNPMSFTHQGANWGGNNYPGKKICTDELLASITKALETCAEYEKKTGRTVWVNEWGVYLGDVIKEEVSKYLHHFTSECARLDLSYAFWEFNSGFGAFDNTTQKWKDYVYGSLVTKW